MSQPFGSPIAGFRLSRAVAAVVLLIGATRLEAQSVQGHVLDADAGIPVVGAMVVAIDSGGQAGGATITDQTGRFDLTLPDDFDYAALRVTRIGYDAQSFARTGLSAGRPVVLRARSAPVALAPVEIIAESGCGPGLPNRGAVYAVWQEARKALEMTDLSQRQRVAQYEVVRYVRSVDPGTGEVRDATARRQVIHAAYPYRTLSTEQMTESGWVQEAPEGGLTYYAPDAALLLSDAFAAQHCFGVETTGDAFLIHFVPNRSREEVADVRGYLSLDRSTFELSELRFEYVGGGMPAAERERPGGRVFFYSQADGLRTVREWYVRIPITALRNSGFRVSRRVTAIREEGGRVEGIQTADGTVALPPLLAVDMAEDDRPTIVAAQLVPSSRPTENSLGTDLLLTNGSDTPVRVTSVTLTSCVNVQILCGEHPVQIVIRPGEEAMVLRVWRDDLLQRPSFVWSYLAVAQE